MYEISESKYIVAVVLSTDERQQKGTANHDEKQSNSTAVSRDERGVSGQKATDRRVRPSIGNSA